MGPQKPKLTGDFNKDEQALLDYTMQEINFKKTATKAQIGILILLIAIFSLLGYYLFHFAMAEKELKSEYGTNYYCYKCGFITGKSCECNYIQDNYFNSEEARQAYFINLGIENTASCDKTNQNLNFSSIVLNQ